MEKTYNLYKEIGWTHKMNTKEIILTPSDELIFQALKIVVQGLGAYLGEGCEIVLHSLADLHASAIEVIHGHHSGRQKGAPITNLALKMLEDIESGDTPRTLAYFNKIKNGITIKSATIPIVGESERIIGLLCINFYMNIALSDFLSTFTPLAGQNTDSPHMIESFSQNVDELISEAVAELQDEIMNDPEISVNNKNKEIVIRLEEKGIFNIKDAVIKVAEQLDISKNTVYMHLRNNRK